MRGSVTPAVLEAIEKPAVRQKRQPLRSQRRTAGISCQTLQPHAVSRRNADTGMDAEAGNRRTEDAGGRDGILEIHRVTHSGDTPAGARPRSYVPRDRGTVEFGKQRLVAPNGIQPRPDRLEGPSPVVP